MFVLARCCLAGCCGFPSFRDVLSPPHEVRWGIVFCSVVLCLRGIGCPVFLWFYWTNPPAFKCQVLYSKNLIIILITGGKVTNLELLRLYQSAQAIRHSRLIPLLLKIGLIKLILAGKETQPFCFLRGENRTRTCMSSYLVVPKLVSYSKTASLKGLLASTLIKPTPVRHFDLPSKLKHSATSPSCGANVDTTFLNPTYLLQR